MTLLLPEENDTFEIQIQKRLVAYPDREWTNNYTARAGVSPTLSALNTLVDDLCAFEQAIHNDTTEIFRSKVWLVGTVNKFKLVARELVGSIAVDTSDPEPLETVLLISKTPAIGRTGVSAYRDCLQEANVTRSNGLPKLQNYSNIQTRISDAVTAHIEGYLDGTAEYSLVKWSASDEDYVGLASFNLKNVGTRNLHNRWFNRTV